MTAPRSLAGQAGSNVRWVMLAQAGRVGLQMVTLLLLARLLPPADFGLAALVVAVSGFVLIWRDLGTATAIVRERTLRPTLVNAVFWLNVGVGLAIAGLMVLLREPLAAVLGELRLSPLLALVACSFPLQGAAAVHQALLERDGRFGALAAIELTAGLLGLSSAVAAALAGWGAKSLVLQTVVSSAVSCALLWWRSGWRPAARLQAGELRGLLHFSGHLTAFNVVNYATRNADTVLIGRVLGPGVLGAYSLAMRVALFPVQHLTWAASRAMLPVMNRPQQAEGELATLYLRSLALITLLSAPLMAGLFVLREDFVAVVLGPQWPLTADLLAWLAPVGFVQSMVSTVGPVYLAHGRSDVLMRMGLTSLALVVAALVVGLPYGPQATAAAYLAAFMIQAPVFLHLTLRRLGRGLGDLGGVLAAPTAGVAALMLAIAGLQSLSWMAAWPAPLRLLALTVVGGAAYAALAWSLGRAACLDLLKLLRLRR